MLHESRDVDPILLVVNDVILFNNQSEATASLTTSRVGSTRFIYATNYADANLQPYLYLHNVSNTIRKQNTNLI